MDVIVRIGKALKFNTKEWVMIIIFVSVTTSQYYSNQANSKIRSIRLESKIDAIALKQQQESANLADLNNWRNLVDLTLYDWGKRSYKQPEGVYKDWTKHG